MHSSEDKLILSHNVESSEFDSPQKPASSSDSAPESSASSTIQQSNVSHPSITPGRSFTRTPGQKRKKKRVCIFCKRGILTINYKDTELLTNYVRRYNKILSSKISGNCIKHQHQLATSIKRARFVALLPFVCS